jgi:hypothetical protein
MSNWTRDQRLVLVFGLATVLLAFATIVIGFFQQELRRAGGFTSQPEIKPVGSPAKQSPRNEPTTNPSPRPTQATNDSAATEPIPNQGWAYYGLVENGRWTTRYFKKASGKPNASPQVGDVVIATGDVHAREGYKEWIGGKWVDKDIIGVIKPNVRLQVLNVYVVPDVQDTYIWIKFARVD